MKAHRLMEWGKPGVQMERFPLDRAAEAYERLRAGTIDGRAVVVP